MRPKSLCMRYFFVDVPAHCIKNALFVECISASTKKGSAYMQPFFVDALAHYIKTHIICGMCQRIYKKVAHTQAFRTHFRLTWPPKPETGTRNLKPKPFKMHPSLNTVLDLESRSRFLNTVLDLESRSRFLNTVLDLNSLDLI